MPRLLNLKLAFFCLLAMPATSTPTTGQDIEKDWDLIQSKNFHPNAYKRDVSFMFMHTDSKIVKYNPVTLAFGAMLFVYQKCISNQLSAGCRFHPSCSAFSKQAIQEFGLVKGMALSADRLTRCNRVAATSYHPVRVDPETGKLTETMGLYHWHEKE